MSPLTWVCPVCRTEDVINDESATQQCGQCGYRCNIVVEGFQPKKPRDQTERA